MVRAPIAVSSSLLALLVLSGSVRGQCVFVEEQKVVAHDGDSFDEFGAAISMDGSTLLVGARYHVHAGEDTGAAYVYAYDGHQWIQSEELLDPDGEPEDLFGTSVSICGDVLVVGAPGDTNLLDFSGSATIFRFDGAHWVFEQKITAAVEEVAQSFGTTVAIDGDHLFVGTVVTETVHVFHREQGVWKEIQKLTGSFGKKYGWYGKSLDLSGDRAIVGAPRDSNDAGVAYVYRFDGTQWQEEQALFPSDPGQFEEYAWSVALDGDVAAVGMPIYQPSNRPGAVVVFRFDGTQWNEEQYLLAGDGIDYDFLGKSVDVRGDVIVAGADGTNVGGDDSGSCYVFRHNGDRWVELEKGLASDGVTIDLLGRSVATNGTQVLGGAPGRNDFGRNSGAVYAFDVPDLALGSSAQDVSVGDSLSIESCGGSKNGLVLVFAVEVDGVPTFERIAFGRFGPKGRFVLKGTVPPELGGHTVTFLALGYVDPTTRAASNLRTVSFH